MPARRQRRWPNASQRRGAEEERREAALLHGENDAGEQMLHRDRATAGRTPHEPDSRLTPRLRSHDADEGDRAGDRSPNLTRRGRRLTPLAGIMSGGRAVQIVAN